MDADGRTRHPSIAVVILTFNEEENIDDCLDSVGDWAEEIFVVDSFSTDATIDRLLARNDPRLRVVQHTFTTHSAQWNWALSNLPIKAAWTLKLDADERITPEFKAEVEEALAHASPTLEGVLFKRRVVFLGRRLGRVGTLWYDLRLWRTGRAVFDSSTLNEHANVKGDTIKLKAAIDHHDNKTISEWLDKHNRYSSIMAAAYGSEHYKREIRSALFGNPVERTKFIERLYMSMPFKRAILFLFFYIIRAGFVDQRPGFHYCMLRSFYFYLIEVKILESRLARRVPDVIDPPRGQPDPRLLDFTKT